MNNRQIFNSSGFSYDENTFRVSESGKFQITRNLSTTTLHLLNYTPDYFPCSESGAAVLILGKPNRLHLNVPVYEGLNINSQIPGSFLKLDDSKNNSYSVRYKEKRSATIQLFGEEVDAIRKTGICSGIKSCAYSLPKCSVSHSGYQIPTTTGSSSNFEVQGRSYIEEEFSLARQIFFFAQTFYYCSIHSPKPTTVERNSQFITQRRTPQWTYVVGSSSASSRKPNFIGCKHYQPGRPVGHKCTGLELPSHLHEGDYRLVNQLITSAVNGNYPEPLDDEKNRCPPYELCQKYCTRRIHEFETVPLVHVNCHVRYHVFVSNDIDHNFLLIVGYGVHTHERPLLRPSKEELEKTIHGTLDINPFTETRKLSAIVYNDIKKTASINRIRKVRTNFKRSKHMYGTNYMGLVRQYYSNIHNSGEKSYIVSLTDERELDRSRSQTNQVGVIICLCNYKLLRMAVSRPVLGCDGTFNVVAVDEDNLKFELLCIVGQCDDTGKVYSPFKALTSRKTLAARKKVFQIFISEMVNLGLPDPLHAIPSRRLTLATDFETTFAIAFGQALVNHFRPGQDNGENWISYVRMLCFGCDVHAKRCMMEKTSVNGNCTDYLWAVGTRKVDTEQGVTSAISAMKEKGGKWFHFSCWLEMNIAARILWFSSFYKKDWNFVISRYAMWQTNCNEAYNSQLKGSSDFLLRRGNGLSIVELVEFLHVQDTNMEHSLDSSTLQIQHSSQPLWRRAPKKRKRVDVDDKIVVGEVTISASQPKKAKKC